jgi:hypothetical protein
MPLHRPLLGALAAAALLAAGCGSSSDDSKTAPAKPTAAKKAAAAKAAAKAKADAANTVQPDAGPTPTREAYTKQADQVCREARTISAKANAAVQKAYQAKASTQAADVIDHYGPLYAKKIVQLEKLPRPVANAKVLTAFLKVLDTQALALQATSRALRTSDSATLQQLTQLNTQNAQFAETLGKNYGFKVCGRAA